MKNKKNARKSLQEESPPVIAADDPIPTLTDIVTPASLTPSDETLAALQDELAARVQKLAEELLHGAAREMEAVLFEKVCDRLRAQLPDLIDETVRARLK